MDPVSASLFLWFTPETTSHTRLGRWISLFLLRILNSLSFSLSSLTQISFNFLLFHSFCHFFILLHSTAHSRPSLPNPPGILFLFAQACSGAAGHPGSFWNSSHTLLSLTLLCFQIFHSIVICQSGLTAFPQFSTLKTLMLTVHLSSFPPTGDR